MSGLRWALCNRIGAEISSLDQRSGGEVEIALNGPRRARVTASLEEEVAYKAQAFATALKVWLRGHLIFFGPVNLPNWKAGERIVELSAICPSERLAAGFTVAFAKQALVDESVILSRLVDHLNDRGTFFGGPTTGVIDGTLASGTLRDRFYPDGTSVWEAMVAMSEVVNGPDFELEPQDLTNGTYAKLNTFLPYQGTDRSDSVVFAHNVDEANASDFNYESGGGEIVNYMIAGGQAVEGEPAPAWLAFDLASIDAHGIYEAFESYPDIKYTAQLQEIAETRVATRAWPVEFFDVTPAAVSLEGTALAYAREGEHWVPKDASLGVPPPVGPPGSGGKYWIGDEVRGIARKDGLDRNVVGRVQNLTLAEVGERSELLATKLTAAPHITAAGVTGAATTLSTEDFS